MKKAFILGTMIFVMAIFAAPAQQGTGNVVSDYTSADGPNIRYIGDYAILDGVLISYSGDDEHLVIPANLGITEIGTGAFIKRDERANNTLISVVVPSGVRVLAENAFADCYKLELIALPDSLISIGDSAFHGTNLSTITIPRNVNSIGNRVFENCNNLQEIVVDQNNRHFASVEGVLLNSARSTLIQYPTARTGSYTVPGSVTHIGDNAFSNNRGLNSISISSNTISIGDRAFNYCSSLTSITTSGIITDIGDYAFAGSGLVSIDLTDGLINIGDGAFRSCNNLTSINLPVSLANIGYSAFSNCNNLLEIVVDQNNRYFSSEDGVLFDITKTTLIQFPGGRNGHYSIPNTVTDISGVAFSGSSLSSITMSNSMSRISGFTFYNSRGLTSVIIPENVNFIGSHAFNGSITNIHIGSNVDIHELAFGTTGPGFSSNYNRFFNHFFQLYRRTGSAAGTYTRPDTSSTTWTYTP